MLGVRMKHSIAYIRIQKNMMGIHFYIGTISIVVQFLNLTIVTKLNILLLLEKKYNEFF